jgi:hypothetical protein
MKFPHSPPPPHTPFLPEKGVFQKREGTGYNYMPRNQQRAFITCLTFNIILLACFALLLFWCFGVLVFCCHRTKPVRSRECVQDFGGIVKRKRTCRNTDVGRRVLLKHPVAHHRNTHEGRPPAVFSLFCPRTPNEITLQLCTLKVSGA